MEKTEFTIIIPAYNASGFIRRAVDSVRNQDLESWEIVIVENGSSDDTYDTACSLSNDKIHVFQSEKGVSNARNLGIDKAQGDWLVFLDADDELMPGALRAFDELISEDVSLVVGRYEHSNTDGNKIDRYLSEQERKQYLCACLNDPTQKCTVKALAVKRDLIEGNKIRFNKDLRYAEDSVFFVDILRSGAKTADSDVMVYRSYLNASSAVHSMDLSVVDRYEDAIKEMKERIDLSDKDIANAFYVFTVSQLLVILVNGVYRSETFARANSMTKGLCDRGTFKEAISKVDIGALSITKKITIGLIKLKWYFPVGLIVKMRIAMNAKKSSETV